MRARFVGWLALALWVPALAAQNAPRSSTTKFFAGLGLNGSSIKAEDGDAEDRENGSGGQFQIGYGFTPRFALFIEGTSAGMTSSNGENDYILRHGDIGVRYSFANAAKAWIPFLDLAATGRSMLNSDEDFEATGQALTVGGGLHYFFKPKWAFTTSLKVSVGEFDTGRVGSVSVSGFEVDATTTRVGLGVTWFPKG
jgi:hypothetical protein